MMVPIELPRGEAPYCSLSSEVGRSWQFGQGSSNQIIPARNSSATTCAVDEEI